MAGAFSASGVHQHAQFSQPFAGRALYVSYRVPSMHLHKALDLTVLKMEPAAGQGQGALNFVEDEEIPSLDLLPVHPPEQSNERGGRKVAGGEPQDFQGAKGLLKRL